MEDHLGSPRATSEHTLYENVVCGILLVLRNKYYFSFEYKNYKDEKVEYTENKERNGDRCIGKIDVHSKVKMICIMEQNLNVRVTLILEWKE